MRDRGVNAELIKECVRVGIYTHANEAILKGDSEGHAIDGGLDGKNTYWWYRVAGRKRPLVKIVVIALEFNGERWLVIQRQKQWPKMGSQPERFEIDRWFIPKDQTAAGARKIAERRRDKEKIR